MLRGKGIGLALRVLREVDIGDVHDALVTLSCFDAELRHREALETMRFAPAAYRSWDKAEAHFRALEALACALQNLGL